MPTTTLPAGTTIYSVQTTVAFGDVLQFPPNATATLVMDNKNLVVYGRLEMHPANSSVIHTVRFINVTESTYTGAPFPDGTMGSMTPSATDIGLWVMDTGVADWIGSPKAGWNRTGDDPTWEVGDDMKTTPFNSGDFTTFAAHVKGGPLLSVSPGNGQTYTQEAFNLTRNVRFEGTSGRKAHVMIMTPGVVQTIKYCSFQLMGPRKLNTKGESALLRGRWSGVHFHHCGDIAGSLVEGVVVRDGGGHAFVSHDSHNVTFRDCISYSQMNDAYWWDNEKRLIAGHVCPCTNSDYEVVPLQLSSDVIYDHCMAAKTLIGEAEGGSSNSGFLLEAHGGTITDCVAVGNLGTSTSAGFTWPEFAGGPWTDQDNVAHNNFSRGVYIWQNIGGLNRRELFGFVGFRNGQGGITNGAYDNNYHHNGAVLFQNSGSGDVSTDFIAAATAGSHNGTSWKQVVQDCWFGDMGVIHHVTGPPDNNSAVYRNNHLGHVRIDEFRTGTTTFHHSNYDFVENDCEEPEDFCNQVHPHAGNHTCIYMYNRQPNAPTRDQLPSIFRVQRADGTAFRLQQVGTSNTEFTAVTIAPFAFSVPPQSLTQAATGVAYSQTLVKAFGETGGAITWGLAVGSGPLPAGLSLSTAGVISGTPTSLGTYPITVEATDVSTQHARRTLSLVVTGTVVLQITTASLPGGSIGTAYSQTIVATGGTAPRTFSLAAGSLPPGLVLSSGGVLSGTPTTANSYGFTVRVTDNIGATATRVFSVTIINLNPVVNDMGAPVGEVGIPFSAQATASAGTPPYTFASVGGPLPAGVFLSLSGAFSGTPGVKGTYPITIRVTDATARTATRNVTITIVAVLSMPDPVLPDASVGTPYSFRLLAQGGSPPYHYSIDSSPIPGVVAPGLTIPTAQADAFGPDDGLISGTPTTVGNYALTISVEDLLGGSTSTPSDIVMTVNEQLEAPDIHRHRALILRGEHTWAGT